MRRSRVLLAVALLALGACGEGSEETPEEPVNYRGTVTGTYQSSGTMRYAHDGEPRTTPIPAAGIRIAEYASDIKALKIAIEMLYCPRDIDASMTGPRTFKVVRAMCWLPTDEPNCRALLELNEGNGTRSAGRLTLVLKGKLTVTCGAQSSSTAPIHLDFSGTHTGDSLPGTSPEAMSEPANLSTLLQVLPRVSGD